MDVIKRFLSSRKFWAFLTGFVTLIGTAFEDGTISAQETQAISALVIGYIFSVAWEDSAHAHAAGQVAAAATTQPTPPTVGIDANNVMVTESTPTVGLTGLR